MRECKATIVPTLEVEECKGCYTNTKCIINNTDNRFLDIKQGDKFEEVFEKLLDVVRKQSEKIKNLEDIITTM